MKQKKKLFVWLLMSALILSACADNSFRTSEATVFSEEKIHNGSVSLSDNENNFMFWYKNLPPYEREESIFINDGIPFFTEKDITTEAFEIYSDLDELERCGTAFANICPEIMPAGERENIRNIKPTGWHTVRYDVISEKYLYNRCHLIGYQLAGENANEKNLITGTRYLNVEGMLPWENLVAEYVEKTGNHVLYRVTPYFEGKNLVSSFCLMEAYSVEDKGAGICFNVYCYNVQPGIVIDYATGESKLDESWTSSEGQQDYGYDYVLNTNTKKFHDPSCASVRDIDNENRDYFTGDRENLIKKGYSPCGRCKP